MFDTALSAQCADVVSPWGNNRAAISRPLAPPLGELASKASLRGRMQWQTGEKCHDCCMVPLSVMAPMRKLAATYALSVTAFSRASSPIGRAKGRASPPSASKPHPRTTKTGTRPSWVMSRFCVAFCRRVWYAYKRYYQYPGRRFP